MADRYKIISEFDYCDIFFDNMPVALIKSRILFDNETQKIVTQIKLMNISDQDIDTVYLALGFYDVSGTGIAKIDEHIMAMLNAQNNQTFGENFPVYISDPRVAKVKVLVTKVVFVNGEVWDNTAKRMGTKVKTACPIEIKPALKTKFLDEVNRLGVSSVCQFEEQENYVRCSCGFLNSVGLSSCRSCKASFETVRKCFSEEYLTNSIYSEAENIMNSENIDSIKKAVLLFENISSYSDSAERAKECRERIEKFETEKAEIERLEAEKKENDKRTREESQRAAQKRRKLVVIASSIAVICIATVVLIISVITNNANYSAAMDLFNSGNYQDAAKAFKDMGGHYDMVIESWNKLTKHRTLSAGAAATAGVSKNGSVYTTGKNDEGECNTESWNNIIAVSVGDYHTIGLKSDGTTIIAGSSICGLEEVNNWKDIVAISSGSLYALGLRYDGTVVSAGDRHYERVTLVSNWNNIVGIAAGDLTSIGLKSDGTVVAAGRLVNAVSEWTDITAIEIGGVPDLALGLKKDGTVVVSESKYDVSGWSDIIDIAVGNAHLVGLKSDGTVIAIGNNDKEQCNVSDWNDIVAVSAGNNFTVGLKSDGSVISTGDNSYGRCDVSNWKDIKVTKS